MTSTLSNIVSRMDKLYEFDREEVTPDKLHSGSKFAGVFAGEHVAASGLGRGVWGRMGCGDPKREPGRPWVAVGDKDPPGTPCIKMLAKMA